GVWDASTNTPFISDATGSNSFYYIAAVAGTQNLGSGNISFAVGDNVIHNGSIYQVSPNPSQIVSVNGKTGVVVLTTANIGDGVFVPLTQKGTNNGIATLDAGGKIPVSQMPSGA